MREIRTSGSTRGQQTTIQNRLLSYSTGSYVFFSNLLETKKKRNRIVQAAGQLAFGVSSASR